MYVCMRFGNSKTQSRAVSESFFPFAMAEQPIQQMVIWHMCFQEHTQLILVDMDIAQVVEQQTADLGVAGVSLTSGEKCQNC